MENVDRKDDVMSELREKVALLTVEKRMMETEAAKNTSELANQLAVKDAELGCLRGELAASRTASASGSAADLRDMTHLKEVVARVFCCDFVLRGETLNTLVCAGARIQAPGQG
jgi:hypothetical protein